MRKTYFSVLAAIAVCLGVVNRAPAQEPPEFPPFDQVTQGFEKVNTTGEGAGTLFTVYHRAKDGQLLAELPRDFASQKYFLALTVASGEEYAGLQAGDVYGYFRRFDKRLAFIVPNLGIRSEGDPESRASVSRLFTDQVLTDMQIVTQRPPMGGPVIDLDGFLLDNAPIFFGTRVANRGLMTVKTLKAFEKNVEIGIEVPVEDGRLKTLHFSISVIPDNTGYKPRISDERIGYFSTTFTDLGRYTDESKHVRYINRWHLEKRDPSLKLSQPKEAIKFYIEHSTPVRYRPWVKHGILAWNEAFEKIGFRDAIEVYQQDAVTGEHMDKDPENVKYNFVRWLNNDIGTAIGPSRVHPLTGQILDADIILTDGWIRHFANQHKDVLPQLAMENFTPETLAWLEEHPTWDPRVLFADPAQRTHMLAERAARGPQPFGGHPLSQTDATMIGDDMYDGLYNRQSQVNGMCMYAAGKSLDMGLLRMSLEMMDPIADEAAGEVLDGMPENFIGPLIAEVVTHEVGHTLGLRHNFKASGIRSLAEINSPEMKGQPSSGSVMDYLPININMEEGRVQGDYAMLKVGPYDLWAIEYGYTLAPDLKPILDRVADPNLKYGTDEDTIGPDPLVQRYDYTSNPLEYAESQIKLAKHHRGHILDKMVKDGDSWARARAGYELTLGLQVRSLRMMSSWVGGAHLNRDHKADPNGRPPLEVVPAATQRAALDFVIRNSMPDDAFGLTPELLRHLGPDFWGDTHGASTDSDYPVHDRVMGIQGSMLTGLLNPSTLRRVYDNELRTPSEEDMLTLPELLDKISGSIWTELDTPPASPATARKPWISSLRRNLQRQHMERLIDLTMPSAGFTAAHKPISNLARANLETIKGKLESTLGSSRANMDPYTSAHLSEALVRITKALDADYIVNNEPPAAPLPIGLRRGAE